VHTWLFTADLYGRLAAWLAGVPACRARGAGRPVIMSAVRSVELDKPAHYVAVDRLLRRVTDGFTVNARAIGDILVRREHVDPSRIHTVYNGVDLSLFDPLRVDGAARRRFALGEEVPLIGIVGRFDPVKDHATFLRGAALVTRQLPHARFLIVGSGPLDAQLHRLVDRLGLAASVLFMESQSDVAAAFAAMDVVVVSSQYEGCCNVILEAMAMGKPVIATAVGGNPELVVPGHTGLLVPAQDSHAMANAIVRLVKTPHDARAMGRAGRQRIEQQFSLSRMIDEYERLYRTEGHGVGDGGRGTAIARVGSGRQGAGA
jgi:glycosyltransferase involved in cell wall biosynthesis